MRLSAVLALGGAAMAGVAMLAAPSPRAARHDTGIVVVSGRAPPPGAAVIPTTATAQRVMPQPAATPAASIGAWGDPGIWATPAEFAPPEQDGAS